MPLEPDRAFVVFQCGGTMAALPLEGVDKITPMAELTRPPGLPAPLEGILNLGGAAVPVLRLAHLLGLPQTNPGLYSMLILSRLKPARPLALLVDHVSEILHISANQLLPVRPENSFNACVQAIIQAREEVIQVLSPAKILLEKEREILAGFLEREQGRLADWGKTIQ